MEIRNKSSYDLLIEHNGSKHKLNRSDKIKLENSNGNVDIRVFVCCKPKVKFSFFPTVKATSFLEDHAELILPFNLSLLVKNEGEIIELVDCSCKCDCPIKLVTVIPNDYADIEKAEFFAPSYSKMKRKLLLMEIMLVFLLALWIFGCILGLAIKDTRIFAFSLVCLIFSVIEAVKLVRSVNGCTDSEMVNALQKRAELTEMAKDKDNFSQKLIQEVFKRI